jgi:hypothetical protein
MLLQEAIKLLEQGVPVSRKAWSLKDGYLQLMLGMDYIWKIVLQPSPNAGNYIFTKEDLTADDWELFSLPATIEAVVEDASELAAA